MVIQDLIAFLAANVAATYYPNQFPAKGADSCAVVKLTGGGSPDVIKGIKSPSFQILVRAVHPGEAEDKAVELFDFLDGNEFFDVGDVFVAYCRADQSSPVFIGKDENGRSIYSLNFTCKTIG